MTSLMDVVWGLGIFFTLLNIILYAVFRDRYLYGAMVIAIRFTQRDKNPFLCKIRLMDPIGPIEDVCERRCEDYEECKKLGRR